MLHVLKAKKAMRRAVVLSYETIVTSVSHLPEPDDLFAVACVVTINGVPLPVLQIHLLHATQHHLKHRSVRHRELQTGQTAQTNRWRTSSSFSSKYCSHCSGTTSLKPSRNALVWLSTPRENLHSAISLRDRRQRQSQKHYTNSGSRSSYPIYSSLFSSVTRRSAPSSFRSWDVILPRISMSTVKYISKPHSSMSLSLWKNHTSGNRSLLWPLTSSSRSWSCEDWGGEV